MPEYFYFTEAPNVITLDVGDDLSSVLPEGTYLFARAMPVSAEVVVADTEPDTFVLIEDATGGIININTGDGVTTVIITAPDEYAGTYEVDGADFASGPLILKAPVLSEPLEISADTPLEVTPALIAWDAANGTMTAEYRIERDDVLGEVVSDLEYTVADTDLGVTLAVQVDATDSAGSRTALSNDVLVPDDVTPTPTEMAISGMNNAVAVLTYWTAEVKPISGADNEVNATWA